MTEILRNALNIAGRIHDMQAAGTLALVAFSVVLVFGLLNCILGYRLLRFWMMIFGFLLGAAAGLFGVYQMGAGSKGLYVAGMAGAVILLAIIAFVIFKAGIFIMGAGIGLLLTVYIIHPTTSFTFFICLLVGVGIGFLALKFEREVIIVGTSILGGVLSGFATAKLVKMEEIPFGIIFSVGFALVGMLIQFAINRSKYDDYEEDYEEPEKEYRPVKQRKSQGHYTQDGVRIHSSRREDWPYGGGSPAGRRYPEDGCQNGNYQNRNLQNGSYQNENYAEERYQEGNYRNGGNYQEAPYSDEYEREEEMDTQELLDEYGVDEDEVIEEYLEDYYGENKRKKKSASPYQQKKKKKR